MMCHAFSSLCYLSAVLQSDSGALTPLSHDIDALFHIVLSPSTKNYSTCVRIFVGYTNDCKVIKKCVHTNIPQYVNRETAINWTETILNTLLMK